jgi:hypothetical protein
MARRLRPTFGSDEQVVRTLWAIGALGVLVAAVVVVVIHSRWHVGDELSYAGRDYRADGGSSCLSATGLRVTGELREYGVTHSHRVFVEKTETGSTKTGLYVEKTRNCFVLYDLQGGP